MRKPSAGLQGVIMAKYPTPGAVKTRLCGRGGLTPHAATELAWGMLKCVVRRLAASMPVVLAVTPDGTGDEMRKMLGVPDLHTVDQGPGDLGQRLDHVWRQVGCQQPIAFFGCDSPDVPRAAIEAIAPALENHDAAIGPSADGGYWTLAAARYLPSLLHQIDWGSENVYHGTLSRADAAGLRIHRLPLWSDVDRIDDLRDLKSRLDDVLRDASRGIQVDAALLRLGEQLRQIMKPAQLEDDS
jgi:rSAM/selenodomain-associated transferase 1